jgi:DNA-binding beta-propeller fold protein YncE
MPLKEVGIVELPDAQGSSFDHGAFDPKTRRVFVAHTARDRIEVIDHDLCCHFSTVNGFPDAAGVVADGGHVLVTNRRSAQLVWLDACTLETRGVIDTGRDGRSICLASRAGALRTTSASTSSSRSVSRQCYWLLNCLNSMESSTGFCL